MTTTHSKPLDRPAFTVGVSGAAGAVSEAETQRLRERLTLLLSWLRFGGRSTERLGGASESEESLAQSLSASLADPETEQKFYLRLLNDGRGLAHTPVALMVDLSTGLGEAAARMAEELGLPVRTVIPEAHTLSSSAQSLIERLGESSIFRLNLKPPVSVSHFIAQNADTLVIVTHSVASAAGEIENKTHAHGAVWRIALEETVTPFGLKGPDTMGMTAPPEPPSRASVSPEKQALRRAMFLSYRRAEWLDGYNAEPTQSRAATREAFRNLLTNRAKTRCFLDEIPEWATSDNAYVAGLERMATARKRAADLAKDHQRTSRTTLKRMFLHASLAVAFLGAFTEWSTESFMGTSLKLLWAVAAAGMAVTATISYIRRRSLQASERHHDCRALAEGLRVQFYWALVGLEASAASSYLQRQRNDLGWIPSAVQSLLFPASQWRRGFQNSSRQTQVTAVEAALACWVQDQSQYYAGEWMDQRRRLEGFQTAAASLAVAGVLTALLHGLAGSSFAPRTPLWIALILWGSLWGFKQIALQLNQRGIPSPCFDGAIDPPPEKPEPEAKKPGLWEHGLQALVPFLPFQLAEQRTRAKRVAHMALNLLALLPLSIALTTLGLSLCAGLAGFLPVFPEATAAAELLSGLFLLGGALSLAWIEKNLYSEHAYQYHTMATLFQNVADELEVELEALREKSEPDAFEARLTQIRERLHTLGCEALDESAEWLLLHRARPLEPVMPG